MEIEEKKYLQNLKMFDVTAEGIVENWEELKRCENKIFPGLFNMAQIKSNIDIMTLTYGHEGSDPKKFLASKFHFISRQATFALQESQRLTIEFEENKRNMERYATDETFIHNAKHKGLYPDLEIRKLGIAQRNTKLSLYNRLQRLKHFVTIMDYLIDQNDGKLFTNEDFQQEQPDYYEWFIQDKIFTTKLAQAFGVDRGLIEAHQRLCQKSPIPEISTEIKNLFTIFVQQIQGQDGRMITNYEAYMDPKKMLEDSAVDGQLVEQQFQLRPKQIQQQQMDTITEKTINVLTAPHPAQEINLEVDAGGLTTLSMEE